MDQFYTKSLEAAGYGSKLHRKNKTYQTSVTIDKEGRNTRNRDPTQTEEINE